MPWHARCEAGDALGRAELGTDDDAEKDEEVGGRLGLRGDDDDEGAGARAGDAPTEAKERRADDELSVHLLVVGGLYARLIDAERLVRDRVDGARGDEGRGEEGPQAEVEALRRERRPHARDAHHAANGEADARGEAAPDAGERERDRLAEGNLAAADEEGDESDAEDARGHAGDGDRLGRDHRRRRRQRHREGAIALDDLRDGGREDGRDHEGGHGDERADREAGEAAQAVPRGAAIAERSAHAEHGAPYELGLRAHGGGREKVRGRTTVSRLVAAAGRCRLMRHRSSANGARTV